MRAFLKQKAAALTATAACVSAYLKTVASAILADVEPGFQPGGIGGAMGESLGKPGPIAMETIFPGGRMPPSTAGQEARRYFSNGAYNFSARLPDFFSDG